MNCFFKLYVLMMSSFGLLLAESVNLSGTVIGENGQTVSGAQVGLLKAGQKSTTDTNGVFVLNGTNNIQTSSNKPFSGHRFYIAGPLIWFTVNSDQSNVLFRLFTFNGRQIGTSLCESYNRGNYCVSLNGLLGKNISTQTAILVYEHDGISESIPVELLGFQENHQFKASNSIPSLKKKMETIDSLEIKAVGYLRKTIPVSSYTGEIGTLSLSRDSSIFITKVVDTSSKIDTTIKFFRVDGNGLESYYHVVKNKDDSVIYFAEFINENKDAMTVVLSHKFIPIQWVMRGANITIYNRNKIFNPHSSFHAYSADSALIEDTVTLDIYPENLDTVIARIEMMARFSCDNMRNFKTRYNITSFDQLVQLAHIPGDSQYLYMNAAFAFSTAYAACVICKHLKINGLAKREIIGCDPAFKIVTKIGARAAANLAMDLLRNKLDPEPSGISILLCQGAAKYGVCHYRFFYVPSTATGAVDPKVTSQCMRFCTVSMGCFSNICKPMDLSEATLGLGRPFYGDD